MRCERCAGTGVYINADTGRLDTCDECIGGCASCCEGKTVQAGDPGYWPRIVAVPAGLHTEMDCIDDSTTHQTAQTESR